MPTRVEGTTEPSAERIRACTSTALAKLGAEDLDLVVRVWGLPGWLQAAPDGIEASAGDGEISLHRSVLSMFGDARRLCWILYEEVAHVVLSRAGLPHGGHGTVAAFFQEAFAAWFQFDEFVASGRYAREDVRTTPVSSAQDWYELGKHVGAAVAGSAPNQLHLDDWFAQPNAIARKVEMVRWSLDEFVQPLTVDGMVAAYARRPGVT
jgi:hypothetical protein